MSEQDLINKIFDACAEYGTKDVHYELEENGTRTWDDDLHADIQGACIQIINAFAHFKEN